MENEQDKTSVSETVQKTVSISDFKIDYILYMVFVTFLKNPIVFLGLTLLIGALVEIVEYGLRFMITEIGARAFNFLQMFVSMLFRQWIGGAIAYGVYQSLKGKGASFGASLSHGMRHLAPLVCVGFLESLGVFLGALLLAVPGLILMFMWFVAIPACVVERLGPVDSMSRSAKLTKGCRLKILGIFMIMMIFALVCNRITPFFIPDVGPRTYFVLLGLFNSIPFAFINIMPAVIYFELRSIREGVAVQNLANVFD